MTVSRTIVGAALFAVLFAFGSPADAQQRDLRAQFGTRSLEAAQAINRAIRASQQQQHKSAKEAIEKALSHDKNCRMAYYWQAIILGDLGDIEKALASYAQCIKLDPTGRSHLTFEASMNTALTYGRLGESDKARLWFTRALMADPSNRFGQHFKTYRNLAIALSIERDFLSAAIAALYAYDAKPEAVDPDMVREFFEKAQDSEAGPATGRE